MKNYSYSQHTGYIKLLTKRYRERIPSLRNVEVNSNLPFNRGWVIIILFS